MALSSTLLSKDPALEAAAVSDQAHIKQGARGPHVKKIQEALNVLDEAKLMIDGIFGQKTASAVLNYKKKRNIVNRSYQTTPDSIVGRLTIDKLDREMLALEAEASRPLRLVPISPAASRSKAYPHLDAAPPARGESKAKFGLVRIVPSASVFPVKKIDINLGQIGWIEVQDGKGGSLHTTDHDIAVVFDPGTSNAHLGDFVPITKDRQTFGVRSFAKWGSTMILAKRRDPFGTLGAQDRMVVNVIDNRGTDYTLKTKAHNHRPATSWDKICSECELAQSNTLPALYLWTLAKRRARPEEVVDAAIQHEMYKYPRGLAYLNHYLNGGGVTKNEDQHIDELFRTDIGARLAVSEQIKNRRKITDNVIEFSFELDSSEFSIRDFQYMYGTIDFMHVRADFVAGTVKVWFEDTYEWHPPYPDYKCPDPKFRSTDFLHAALVQMKEKGAADFQMRGEATLPMSLFSL